MKTNLKIQSISVRAVVVPMRRPLKTSTGAVSVAPLLLVDLKTSGGIVGRSYLFAISTAHLKPLAAVLEGGTWAAGRELARQRRADGGPPIQISSDGTVF